MAQSTPEIKRNTVQGEPAVTVESAAWFDWLEGASSFRYFSEKAVHVAARYSRPLPPISVRKERRRQGHLWYAYRRAYGQLFKVYVGRSQGMTVARLDEVAAELSVKG